MASTTCNSQNHDRCAAKLFHCLYIDHDITYRRTYCTACFDRKKLGLEFTFKCFLCDRHLNNPCFYLDDKNYCYECLRLYPNESLNIPEHARDEMFDITHKDTDKIKIRKLAKLTNDTLCELLWLKTLLRDKIKQYHDTKHRNQIKEKNDNYTKIQRVSDTMKRLLPEIEELDAHYAAKRLDLKYEDVNNLNFDNVADFVNFLIDVEPLYK